MSRRPESMLPTHIGGEIKEVEEAYKKAELQGKTKEEKAQLKSSLSREARTEALDNAPDLKPDLRLRAVEAFQSMVKEAQDLRSAIKNSKDAKQRILATKLYTKKKAQIDSFLNDEEALSFEKAYREYIRSRLEFSEFKRASKEWVELYALLGSSSFGDIPGMDNTRLARLESINRKESVDENAQDTKLLLESIKTVYSEDSVEYEQAKAELLSQQESKTLTKKDIETKIAELDSKMAELWEDPMIRYFMEKEKMDQVIRQFAEGRDVLWTPSVWSAEIKLNNWENQHQRTTIGGILVGPPGVGKTTLVRDYLHYMGRNYVYIDLSEDVTRYLLYGSKSLEFKDPVQTYEQLIAQLGNLKAEDFKSFVKENSKVLREVFHTKDDETAVLYINQLEEALKGYGEVHPELSEHISELQKKIIAMANSAYRTELGNKFAHIVKKNGWRDGVIISALRRGDSIIMDEFNKNKNWSLIYGLLTAKPGEQWYFADNNEYIEIPENWRMYFTANIDRKHGVFEVAEALASRGQAEVMQVDYPPQKEEMLVGLITLSDPEGNFLRSKEDLGKLYFLINEIFPKIRSYIEGKRQVIPISYRTIRDIGEKLIMYRDPKTKKPIYQPTKISFDQAIYEVLVESYGLYESKETAKEIVSLLTSASLLLDDEGIKDKVIGFIGEQTYNERKEANSESKEDFDKIVKKIRGIQQFATTGQIPIAKTF